MTEADRAEVRARAERLQKVIVTHTVSKSGKKHVHLVYQPVTVHAASW